jgi:hypothetical protein
MAAAANRDVPVTIWGAKDEDMLKQDRDAGVVRVIVSLESAKSDVILPRARPLGQARGESGLAGVDFLPGEAGEVPRRGGGVMGHRDRCCGP